jgi:hypothetical protein
MDGRFSHPLVGRDLLLGCAMGALSKALELAPMAIEGHSGQVVDSFQPLPVLSVATLFDNTVGAGITMVISSLALLFLYGLTFVALRRRHWLAAGLWLLILGGMGFVPGVSVNEMQPSETLWTSIGWALGWALALFVLLRLGILVYVVMGVTADLLARTLPTLDFTAWYSPSMTMGLTLFLAIAAYGLFCSVSWHGGIADALVDD